MISIHDDPVENIVYTMLTIFPSPHITSTNCQPIFGKGPDGPMARCRLNRAAILKVISSLCLDKYITLKYDTSY